ncbi:hypothetical protein ACU61A_20635 [Pseudonocardia sichuanensis]
MNTDRFPVVDERPLLHPERRWLRGRWRDPAQLPVLPPGCVYVFTVDGRPETSQSAARLTGREPLLTDATSVSIVNLRERVITTTAFLPSTDAAVDFVVRVAFSCQVVDAAVVAQYGATDLPEGIATWLRHDSHLAGMRHQFDIEDVQSVRDRASVELASTYREDPPRAPGMRITFAGVDVLTPRELRRHKAELRNTLWSMIEEEHRHGAELKRVEHTKKLLSTPEMAEITAVVRQDSTAAQAAQRQFDARDAQTDRLIEQVREWVKADGSKRAPLDRRQIAEELFVRLTGSRLAPDPLPSVDVLQVVPDTNGKPTPPFIPPASTLDGD